MRHGLGRTAVGRATGRATGRAAGRTGAQRLWAVAGCAVLALALALALGVAWGPAAAQTPAADGPDPAVAWLCTDPLERLERQHGLPPGLLHAIGQTESGRRTADGILRPWPWTINAGGQGRYFATREEAIEAVRALMLDGATNIDIGCMQISLHWHNTRFATLEEMFDPLTNLTYAAEYLVELQTRHGSWERAIGHYHSSDPQRRAAYLRRVFTYWQRDGVDGAVASVEDPHDTLIGRAATALAEGRADDALTHYAERLADAPDDRVARLGEALALESLDDAPAAQEAWERLLVLNPNHPQALHRLSAAARSLPPAEAEARTRDLLRLAPGALPFTALLAELLAARGEIDDAVAVLRASALRDPAAPLPWLNAAILLDRAGRQGAALQYYRAFLERYTAAPVPLTVPLDRVTARIRHLERGARG